MESYAVIYVFVGIPVAVILLPIVMLAFAAESVMLFEPVEPVPVNVVISVPYWTLLTTLSSDILAYSIVILHTSWFFPNVAILFE